ncbi:putative O-methylsterigmatocystin oxidoreductase [Lophium mytilinum]|uniref:Putative O-methylsterigmatocystin oxidoreductase n=1 Tax=Lophium mytilinum TaxID=390894 RepID=A0A6A6RD43_9PEZI|nr:putative O-methylsterigmatocystin oxidoreductase [Lophium mytilinum]
MYTTTLLFGAALLTLLYAFATRRRVPRGYETVPGPQGSLLFGHTSLLGAEPQAQLKAWAKDFGPLFKLRLGWEDWIFVNEPGAIREIFDKQSRVTSGRAPMPVLSDILSGGKRFLLQTYTPEWRKLRTIVHKLLTPKSSSTFKPSQEFETKQLLHDIYTSSKAGDQERFYMHVRRYTTSVIMTSIYGRRIPEWECEDVEEIYGLMKDFSDAARPGAYIADVVPPLARLPTWMQWWRKSALKAYERQASIWLKYWNQLRAQIKIKTAPECFAKQFVEDVDQRDDIDEVTAAFVAGTMIEAGSETTSSSVNSGFKYLAAYPEVQQKAHEEISRVIGDGRSPTFDDEDNLPYIRAMVKEILRLRPVTNLGSPHYTTEDMTYQKYFIPKHTVVAICQYAAHNDARYPEPETFRPERYLDHPLKAGAYAAHPDPYVRDHFTFGAGRRICPGMHLAENSMFIVLAKILWAFEIRPVVGPDGKEENVDVSDQAYEPGINTLPKPYRMRFLSRSPAREAKMLQEWKEAESTGYYLGNVRVDAAGMVLSA